MSMDPEEIQRQTTVLEGVAADLARDRTERQVAETERKRTSRIARWAVVIALVLSLIDLGALGLLLRASSRLDTLTSNNHKLGVSNRALLIEQHQSFIILKCAVSPAVSAAGADRAAARRAYDDCVAKAS